MVTGAVRAVAFGFALVSSHIIVDGLSLFHLVQILSGDLHNVGELLDDGVLLVPRSPLLRPSHTALYLFHHNSL